MRVLKTSGNVFLLRFLPDGRRLLVGTETRTRMVRFRIWPLAGGRPVVLDLPRIYMQAWGLARRGNPVAIDPTGQLVYVAWDGKVWLCRTADGQRVPKPWDVRGSQVVLSSDGVHLASAWFDFFTDDCYLYRARTDAPGACSSSYIKRPKFQHLVGFLPGGKRLVTIHGGICVDSKRVAPYPALYAHQPELSPDGGHLGVISAARLYLFDRAGSGRPRTIGGARKDGAMQAFAFHPSGKTVAAVHDAGLERVRVYELGTLECRHTLDWGLGMLSSVAFSPDGTLGAAGSMNGRIVIWDADE